MHEVFSFLLIMLLLPYLVVPILIRRNQYFSVKPNMRMIFDGFLPKTVEHYFNQTKEELTQLGFEHRLDVLSLDFGPNIKVFMRLFIATPQSILAIATSLLPDGEKKPLKNYLEFNSRFKDGHELSTHNSDLAGAPIEGRQKIISSLPLIHDSKTLLAFHEHVVMRRFADAEPLLPKAGDELDALIENFRRDLSRQASLGCLTLDRAHNVYRPTWAGAFLMGWYSMWPLSFIRRWVQKVKAKIQLKAIRQP